jgi:hypothetical protein
MDPSETDNRDRRRGNRAEEILSSERQKSSLEDDHANISMHALRFCRGDKKAAAASVEWLKIHTSALVNSRWQSIEAVAIEFPRASSGEGFNP